MMKLSGALLLVLGCAGFGWCTCRDMERHIGQLHLLSRAFSMLESEVGYSRATLPEGLIRVGNRLGGRLGECFINVGKKAQGPEGITFAAAWDEEVAGFLKETCLDKKGRGAAAFFSRIHRLCGWADAADISGAVRKRNKACGRKSEERNRKPQKGGSFRKYGWRAVDCHIADMTLKENGMGVSLIFKIAAVGILVTILSQILKHSGREEHAFLLSLAGLILVLTWVIPYIYDLFTTIQNLFQL